ncbi:MAG: ATP-dependent helicase HrpB, partial [Acidobacteriota bacterium]|nr:ATP-dependent helicase HrpB [Acidobacteriota bacterium]
MLPLPIDPFIPQIVDALARHRAAIVTALPGAGKTTRVPPALAADGPVLLLQPRRVAARSIAARVAAERGWTLGGEVGWQVRFERKFGPGTRLLVATEGILTARLQQDPLASGFRTIVLDEFHERTVHADLGLTLARQAWLARDDLRLVIMSATLDAARVAAFLDDCPIVDVPGRVHPVEIAYAPRQPLADAVGDALARTDGQVLVFLPGAGEIRRAATELAPRLAGSGVETVPLHGSLEAAAQDEAIRPVDHRRVILATNIAETSLTVPGITAVVDTGLHKIARYDPDRGIDSLETGRITQDAADQRAGRAGRLAPGIALRLWDARDRLHPHREPELHRIDLAGVALDVLAWGADPRTLAWFDPPPAEAIEAAFTLLGRLGAVEDGRLADLGRRLHRLPVHPRLGRILIAADGARVAARACAMLSERHFLPPRREATSSDLLSAVDDWDRAPWHVRRAADEIERIVQDLKPGARSPEPFLRAVLAGYPDRVARRREPGSPRVLLASGHGAVIGPESGVHAAEFVVAVDVQASPHGSSGEARVRVASAVERDWLVPNGEQLVHTVDDAGVVRARLIEKYDAIPIAERVVEPDPAQAARLLAVSLLARGLGEEESRLLRRLRFAGWPMDDAAVKGLIEQACAGQRRLQDVDLRRHLPHEARALLERYAPETLAVPSGRHIPLEYQDDGTVVASVKLQELFGLADSPRLGPRAEPVLFALLAPNGRPVQMTRDLRSFWNRTYPEVRKELRAR